MRCLECHAELDQLDNAHLHECCGLTLQEYAIRHHISLDLLINQASVNQADDVSHYHLTADSPSDRANTVLRAMLCVQALAQEQQFLVFNGDIRRLDELLWYARELNVFGFQYRQEYIYAANSHRVIAENKLKVPASYAHKFPTVATDTADQLFTAILLALTGEYSNEYVFLTLPENDQLASLIDRLRAKYQIRMVILDTVSASNTILYRTESVQDGQRLLELVSSELKHIPCVSERYFGATEEAVVSKELVFDSAHFITDHPGKCENLHGGRYNLIVKIRGQIDALTGFVIDYGYLKSVVKHRVIDKLDHQTLNYVAPDIAWRSSTELLNIFIWEQLIDYLPGLQEIQTYETTQSYCTYRGPSLDEMQKRSGENPLKYFSSKKLGDSVLRKQLLLQRNKLKAVSD